ncbi:MAG: hypothetical protein HY690_09785 [Chloroflexi bacterium]|nr:hypothetical protein [Chloroflexota bacterium]
MTPHPYRTNYLEAAQLDGLDRGREQDTTTVVGALTAGETRLCSGFGLAVLRRPGLAAGSLVRVELAARGLRLDHQAVPVQHDAARCSGAQPQVALPRFVPSFGIGKGFRSTKGRSPWLSSSSAWPTCSWLLVAIA